MVLKALLLDLDGVITNTAEYHYQAWKNLAASIGVEIDREFNERLKGISRMNSLEIILESANKQSAYTDEEKEALATQKNNEYREAIKQITPDDIYPGIERLLDDARDAGLKLVMCSASKNGAAILEQLKLTDHFDAIVEPDKITKGKPDPEMFLTGAKMVGAEPNECIGIEDAAAGVEAIKAADGMLAIGVGDAEALIAADVVVDNTETLSLGFLQEIYEHFNGGNAHNFLKKY